MAWQFWRTWIGTVSAEAATSGQLPGHGLDETADELDTGEGGPSLYVHDLAALRQRSEEAALTVGAVELEPEQWENGRMSFELERYLAHEHESVRDRLANHVSAETRIKVETLWENAEKVARAADELRQADQRLATVMHSWNAAYREVHEDELEMGRYFRLKSKRHGLFKWLVGLALFAAELAVSTALFEKVVAQDNPAYPLLFALGLILTLIIVPHYAAIGLKDGFFSFHDAEMRAYDDAEKTPPVRVRKKARREEVDDQGMKFAAGLAGLVLVALVIPLSSLRATELGGEGDGWFWFAFFLFLQTAISGYFFLREWLDHGTASANLKHHDDYKKEAEKAREKAFDEHIFALSTYRQTAEHLVALYRQAPHWDNHIVHTYHATVHYFRHLVTMQRPDLDVFISHATVPVLSARHKSGDPDCGISSLADERSEIARNSVFSRHWWTSQVAEALADAMSSPGYLTEEATGEREARKPTPADMGSVFDSPNRLLDQMLRHYSDLGLPYRRPEVLDKTQEVECREGPILADNGLADGSSKRWDSVLPSSSPWKDGSTNGAANHH